MTMLHAALAAQQRGFYIFPVTAGDKVPHRLSTIVDQAGVRHGWGETASNDRDRILRFWTAVDPHANVGIACKPSQLLVVDLDVPKEPGKLRGTEWEYLHSAYGEYVSGVDLLNEMAYKLADERPYNGYEDTYTVQTGSGGIHLYYWWPATLPRISQASPVKGVIDVRGNGGQFGGYVLAEGSRTLAGRYIDTRPGYGIRHAPDWIVKLVMEKPQQPAVRRPQGLRQPGAISWSGLVDSVRNAGEGNRNNALVWAARTMCEEGATEDDALKTLGPAASAAGLGEMEIERTVQSAFRTQRYKEGRQ